MTGNKLVLFKTKNYTVLYGGEMDYIITKRGSPKMGVTPCRVNYYYAAGCIPGAV